MEKGPPIGFDSVRPTGKLSGNVLPAQGLTVEVASFRNTFPIR
jgi:hypothetical protein